MSALRPMPERLRRALGIRELPKALREQWLIEGAREDALADAQIAADLVAQPPAPIRIQKGAA